MPPSELRLVKRWQPPLTRNEVNRIPPRIRGLYVLYKHNRRTEALNVVYVGMAKAGRRGGIRARLYTHRREKSSLWSHFSVFEVWDNITEVEVAELEGLFRQIYSRDSRAGKLNKQKTFKKLRKVERIVPA
jgi:hypothetical protein